MGSSCLLPIFPVLSPFSLFDSFSLFLQYLHSNLASELGRASHLYGVVLPFSVFYLVDARGVQGSGGVLT
jgi:hypothetical protein